MMRTMSTMTVAESISTFREARDSLALFSKRMQITTSHWQKFQPRSEPARVCGTRNETGFIWLCPQVRKKGQRCGSTRPRTKRNYEDFEDLVHCCQLADC